MSAGPCAGHRDVESADAGGRRSAPADGGAALSAATHTAMPPLPITARLSIDDREVDERFVRASGPGGQNVNKVSTAVELRFDIARSSLPGDMKIRLRTLAGNRVTADGVLVIDSREHRTQAMNREAARARLVALLQQAAVRPRSRRPTRPGKAAKERRLGEKKRRADVKSGRRRSGGDD